MPHSTVMLFPTAIKCKEGKFPEIYIGDVNTHCIIDGNQWQRLCWNCDSTKAQTHQSKHYTNSSARQKTQLQFSYVSKYSVSMQYHNYIDNSYSSKSKCWQWLYSTHGRLVTIGWTTLHNYPQKKTNLWETMINLFSSHGWLACF